MSMGDSVSSILILEIGEAEILPPWTGGARGGVLPAKSDREDLTTEWHEIVGPRKWEMKTLQRGNLAQRSALYFDTSVGPGSGTALLI
jgi:hypothetical protein